MSSNQPILVVHFFPDLIFRAPLPIIFIGTLTVKTIHACNQRSVGNVSLTPQLNRNIPLRLYLLNFKFILCNTLYMFNTILLELLGYGESVESNEEGLIDRYMNSFYLTDASNMLLVLHSASNWLLFYKFPTISKNRRHISSISLPTSYRVTPVRPRVAEFVLRRTALAKRAIGIEILNKIYSLNPHIVSLIMDRQKTMEKPTNDICTYTPSFQQKGEQAGYILERVLKWFCDRGRDDGLRQLGRQLGHAYYHSNIQFSAEQWKTIRAQVVSIIVRHTLREPLPKEGCCSAEELQENLTKVFNFVLREVRSGVLCAAVEAKQHSRSASVTGSLTVPHELRRKSRSVSYGHVRCSFRNSGMLPLLMNETSS